MKKSLLKFTIIPENIIFTKQKATNKFAIKNTGIKNCTYQISSDNLKHYSIMYDQRFQLAPGISKSVIIQHNQCKDVCSIKPGIIKISNNEKESINLFCYCQSDQFVRKLIQFPDKVQIDTIILKQTITSEIMIKNICNSKLQLKVTPTIPKQIQKIIKISIENQQISLLQLQSYFLKINLTILQIINYQFCLSIKVISEKNESQQYKIPIKGCTQKMQCGLMRDQQIIEQILCEYINGSSIDGVLNLRNNMQNKYKYKLIPYIDAKTPQQFAQKWQQNYMQLSTQSGILEGKQSKQIKYTIKSNLNFNDIKLVQKYSQIQSFSEMNKMKNQIQFQKIKQIFIKVIIGQKIVQVVKFICKIITPTISIKTILGKNRLILEVRNDTTLVIPFKISSNSFYKANPEKGKLPIKINTINNTKQILIIWNKQNQFNLFKNNITLTISNINLIVYNGKFNTRPGTAIKKMNQQYSMIKNTFYKTHIAPMIRNKNRIGSQYDITKLHTISKQNFEKSYPKYIKVQSLQNKELQFLKVTSDTNHNILTNIHPQKSMIVQMFHQGYLLLQAQHAYRIPHVLNVHNFTINQLQFPLTNKQKIQKYQLNTKILNFKFISENGYSIKKSFTITNRTLQNIQVCCLSKFNNYFTSEQAQKIIIPGHETINYTIILKIQKDIPSEEKNFFEEIIFQIDQTKQIITCYAELLICQCQVKPNNISFQQIHLGQNIEPFSFIIYNYGKNGVSFQIQQSLNLLISTTNNIISPQSEVEIKCQFKSIIKLGLHTNILRINFRGSHYTNIPITINIIEPLIWVHQQQLIFSEAIIGSEVKMVLTIQNDNKNDCQIVLNLSGSNLFLSDQVKTNSLVLLAGKLCQLKLSTIVKAQGKQFGKLPANFITLKGFSCIKFPRNYSVIGVKPMIEIQLQNLQSPIIVCESDNIKHLTIKNISTSQLNIKLQTIMLKSIIFYNKNNNFNERSDISNQTALGQINDHDAKNILVSCQPNHLVLNPNTALLTKINLLILEPVTTQLLQSYQLSLYIDNLVNPSQIINFKIQITKPHLEIIPNQIYFNTVGLNTISQASFTIKNRGYKSTYFKIMRPYEVNFQLQTNFLKLNNELSTFKNSVQISVWFKSFKNVSFNKTIEIEDHCHNKYTLKIHGTAIDSPFFPTNCLNNEIYYLSTKQLLSSSNSAQKTKIKQKTKEIIINQNRTQDMNFINDWIKNLLYQFSISNLSFNIWLCNAKNFEIFLNIFGIFLTPQENTLNQILSHLRLQGYAMNSLNLTKLQLSCQDEWINFIWHFLSHNFINQLSLTWISSFTQTNVIDYNQAYKKLTEPKFYLKIYKKLIDNNQNNQHQQEIQNIPYFSILEKIKNQKHLIICLNTLYYKFNNYLSQSIKISCSDYYIEISHPQKNLRYSTFMNPFKIQIINNINLIKKTHNRWLTSFNIVNNQKKDKILKIYPNVKQNCTILIYNNYIYDPIRVYKLFMPQKQLNMKKITIQCEYKCLKQQIIQYLCPSSGQYNLKFISCKEINCNFPSIIQLKTDEILQIKIIYHPLNLQQHLSTLIISNNLFTTQYNIKGIATRSIKIQKQYNIILHSNIKQNYIFDIPWQFKNNQNIYTYIADIIENQSNIEENIIISTEIKSNRIKIKLSLISIKLYQHSSLIYQIKNYQLNQFLFIKFNIEIIPKPLFIDAQIICTISEQINEYIPLTNILSQKIIIDVSIISVAQKLKLQKLYLLNNINQQIDTLNQGNAFKLKQLGKITLKSKQTKNITLNYHPKNMKQSILYLKIIYENKQSLIYTFRGKPNKIEQVHPIQQLQCQFNQIMTHNICLSHELCENIKFTIQSNSNILTGLSQIMVLQGSQFVYILKIHPIHYSNYQVQLIFDSQFMKIIYPIQIITINKKQNDIIVVHSEIRQKKIISIQLYNQFNYDVCYQVFCNSKYLKCQPIISLNAKSKSILQIEYYPLFQGLKFAQIRLYEPNLLQIRYRVEMWSKISQQKLTNIKFTLGDIAKTSFIITNNTQFETQIQSSQTSLQIKFQNIIFPLKFQPKKNYNIQISFKPMTLHKYYSQIITLKSNEIGQYRYKIIFQTEQFRQMDDIMMNKQILFKNSSQQKLQYFFDFDNIFTENMTYKILFDGQLSKYLYFDQIQDQFLIHSTNFKQIKIKKIKQKYINQKQIQFFQKQYQNKIIISTCFEQNIFKWQYPIKLVQFYKNSKTINININAHQQFKTKIILQYNIQNIYKWNLDQIQDKSNQFLKLKQICSESIVLQFWMNKTWYYEGDIILYGSYNQILKIPILIKIGKPKYQVIKLQANVGMQACTIIKIKDIDCQFNVDVKNNRLKQFQVYLHKQSIQTSVILKYRPKSYSGLKYAQVWLNSNKSCYFLKLIGRINNTNNKHKTNILS